MPDLLLPLHVLTPQEKIALEIDYDRIRLLNDELRQLHKKKQKLRDEIFRWNVRRSYRKWRLRYKGGCVRGRGGQGPCEWRAKPGYSPLHGRALGPHALASVRHSPTHGGPPRCWAERIAMRTEFATRVMEATAGRNSPLKRPAPVEEVCSRCGGRGLLNVTQDDEGRPRPECRSRQGAAAESGPATSAAADTTALDQEAENQYDAAPFPSGARAVHSKEMAPFREVLACALHRRLGTSLGPAWTSTDHWGLCGQSCPCCRARAGEGFGACVACECADESVKGATVLARFMYEQQRKKDVVSRPARGTAGCSPEEGRPPTLAKRLRTVDTCSVELR